VTKCQTHREDIQRAGTFENYVKQHYNSWVAFARETGHGNDINPVIVTGLDRTRYFAMMSY
jgi:L-rhamnose isomerase